uniref:PAP_RNA-bind domain-containing protein n=1 Tax=Meloidogyne hapla TaxID=6305 RepID=A0A1I8BCQ3_MELHA
MVVLTAGYPEQNCSFNVNYSTRQIIQKELENGYNMIINAKNSFGGQELLDSWKFWLNGYQHYLLILCISSQNNLKENENYCRFVESRIRLELVFSIENNNLVKYAHATGKENCLPMEIKQKYGGHKIQQHWWIGIETNEQINQIEIYKNNEGNNILTKFVEKIKDKTPYILLKTGGRLEMFYYNDRDKLKEC